MADYVAKLAVQLLQKLLTEQFLSRVLYYIVRAWANQTDNKIDDKVADAVAEAYGIDKTALVKP
jgi:hypothetical protein